MPDTSDEFNCADSKLLLVRCVELLREKGYAAGNVDCTISMQRPKLRSHIDRMRETIARTIGIDTDAVSVKATTPERLGFEGREEGVSVAAVALIYREFAQPPTTPLPTWTPPRDAFANPSSGK